MLLEWEAYDVGAHLTYFRVFSNDFRARPEPGFLYGNSTGVGTLKCVPRTIECTQGFP